MHRGRFGGNARKRKAKLTDAKFQAMLGVGTVSDAPIAVIDAELEFVEDIQLLEHEPALPLHHHPVRAVAPARSTGPFSSIDYHFGYVSCVHCRSDQAYYLRRDDLVTGCTFRCRVCRMELTVTVEQ